MSTSGVSSFVYPPVQPGHIRLIKVQRQSNRPYTSCDMKVMRLDDCPQFTALSYTWGGQIPNRVLFVEDAWLKVTPNLYALLLQVQNFGDEAKERGVEWIWADSLCINQQDDADKSLQIGMMGQIYQKAQQIVVWLGEATYTMEKFFRQLEKRDEMLSGDDSRSVTIQAAGAQSITDLQLAEELLSHPYWQRVWVLQEITSSPKNGVSLWYGHASCSFSKILKLILAVLLKKAAYNENDDRRRSFEVLQFLRARRQDGSIKMSDIFSMKGHWEASNPKDKILALLQLSTDGFGYIPDYSLSVYQLHADFARFLIDKYGHLDCLEHTTTTLWREGAGHKSSWAPDWSIEGHPNGIDNNLSITHRTKSVHDYVPFRNTFLEGRLNLSAECRTQKMGEDSQTLHIDAILLAVQGGDENLRDLVYLPRYTEALPDEASLWTAALDPSTVSSIRRAELASSHRSSSRFCLLRDGKQVQNGDILCMLPGLRWPAYIRPERREHESQRHVTFSYVGYSNIPSYRHRHNDFAEQLFDIMLDDVLLNVEATHGSHVTLLDMKKTRQRWDWSPTKEVLDRESVARRRGVTIEEILPDTDLRKYAMRIMLV